MRALIAGVVALRLDAVVDSVGVPRLLSRTGLGVAPASVPRLSWQPRTPMTAEQSHARRQLRRGAGQLAARLVAARERWERGLLMELSHIAVGAPVPQWRTMKELRNIMRSASPSFRGSLWRRFAAVIAVAACTGLVAGWVPGVIGEAVAVVAGTRRPETGLGHWLFQLLAVSASPWRAVLTALVVVVLAVLVGVFSTRLGSALAGDVTAAVRVAMMRAVLGASARDVMRVAKTMGGKKPGPPGVGASSASKKGSTDQAPEIESGAARTAIVRLAVAREAAMVSEFSVSVGTGLPQSIATLLVLGVELMLSKSWLVLLGGLGLFLASRLLADRASRRVAVARRQLQQADARVFGQLQETLAASEDLRLWGAREQAVAEFASTAQSVAHARRHFAAALAVAGQIKRVFSSLSPLLVILALQLGGRRVGAGEVAALLLTMPLLMARLEALDGMRQGLIERRPVIDTTRLLLRLKAAPERAEDALAIPLARVDGEIVFEDVSFQPDGAQHAIVSGINFRIPAGCLVAVCGPSGSGKSTLLRLLLRLDEPSSGRILVDGVALDRIEPELLPELFTVVRQRSQLLERTVRYNLGLGLEPPPTDARMEAILSDMQLASTAEEAQRMLKTTVRRFPANFSGGEARRLLMARMLLSGAPIRVLDEPEAGLPPGTAEVILDRLSQGEKVGTRVVVSHAPDRLQADRVLMLVEGQLIDQGSHVELLERCSAYRRLLSLDAAEG